MLVVEVMLVDDTGARLAAVDARHLAGWRTMTAQSA